MTETVDLELLGCFLDEAVDSLGQWERACLDLENGPNEEIFNALFRSAHNLKGASRAVGLEQFGAFVHIAEDLITLVIKGKVPLTPNVLSVMLECQVQLLEWIEGLRSNPTHLPDTAALVSKVKQTGEVIEESPPPNREVSVAASVQTKIEHQADSPANELDALFAAAQKAYEETHEVIVGVTGNPTAAAAPQVSSNAPITEANTGKKAPNAPTATTGKADETVRVSAKKLDELIQLVGELTIHQSIVFQGKRSNTLDQKICQNAIALSHKITKDLHTKALSLRMQPVQALFQRLERVAKDVARSQGKKVHITIEGTEVELDKAVIERILDPLVHIVRNAIDHGICKPEDRIKNGKPEFANLTIAATQDASSVCIRVIEDGRGLDAERILKKAVEKGLVREGDTLSEKEIQNLIFLPGFSTAEKVTDISGRGVGMDVVMKAVQALQGSIDITSKKGQGTTFAISLPTSVSIVEGLIVKINDLRYVVSMHELLEIIDLSSYTLETTGNKGMMISLRGDVVPVEPLERYVSRKSSKDANQDGNDHSSPALIVGSGKEVIAFEIDEVLGQQSVVVRPLSEKMSKLPGFSGSTVLGDGEPGMILSLSELARRYFEKGRSGEAIV